MRLKNLLTKLKQINPFLHKLVYTKYKLLKNVLYSSVLHQSCHSLSTHHTTGQYALKNRQFMVIDSTYSEIIGASITY